MTTYKLASIPGDGIGPEVIREGRRVLDAAAELDGVTLEPMTWKAVN